MSEIRDDDTVVVRTGEVILIEGEIIKGNAEIRQFCLERKMKTFQKEVGDRVFPFTLIDNGNIYIKVSR